MLIGTGFLLSDLCSLLEIRRRNYGRRTQENNGWVAHRHTTSSIENITKSISERRFHVTVKIGKEEVTEEKASRETCCFCLTLGLMTP